MGGGWGGFGVGLGHWDKLLQAIEEGDSGDLCSWDDRHDSFDAEHALFVVVGRVINGGLDFLHFVCDTTA